MTKVILVASCKRKLLHLLLGFLLGEKHLVDVGKHTTSSDGHTAKQFVELLVIAHGELQVSWDDPLTLVVTSSVSSELKNLSAQVQAQRPCTRGHHCRGVGQGAVGACICRYGRQGTADQRGQSGWWTSRPWRGRRILCLLPM